MSKEVLIIEIEDVSDEDLETLEDYLELNHYSFYREELK